MPTITISTPTMEEFNSLQAQVEKLTGIVNKLAGESVLDYGNNKAVSISQAARLTGCDRSTIYRAIEQEVLKAYKPMGKWRICTKDLESWASTRR